MGRLESGLWVTSTCVRPLPLAVPARNIAWSCGHRVAVRAFPEENLKLPNAHLATIEKEKVTEYLLNPAHPAGGSKAVFFLQFGFTAPQWQRLAEALFAHARENEVVTSDRTQHGMRYVIDGTLRAPDGTGLSVRSAWYIRPGSERPAFVTAHPLPKR